ncbi:MAG TPA: transporter [Chitinophagaceae bacterium]|nr:transporter [Chitinophagaceae bacterium]
MRKIILLFIILTIHPLISGACDICGCGIGNSYLGILPDFRNHIFGLRYRYNSMLTHVGLNGNNTYLTTKEIYNTAEVWGGWNLGTRFRIIGIIPYSYNQRSNQGITNKKNGLGDISLSGFYKLFSSQKTTGKNKLFTQSLWLGGGIKLATGKYNPKDKSSTSENLNLFQLGSGSTDFSISGMYDVRVQNAGLNLSSSYKINTENKYDYQYGNKFNLSAQVYYKFNIKNKVTVAPNAGIQYEKSQKDFDSGFEVSASGGNLSLTTIGVEVSFKKVAIGANFQTSLSQNLADGIAKANNRMMVHFAIAL